MLYFDLIRLLPHFYLFSVNALNIKYNMIEIYLIRANNKHDKNTFIFVSLLYIPVVVCVHGIVELHRC